MRANSSSPREIYFAAAWTRPNSLTAQAQYSFIEPSTSPQFYVGVTSQSSKLHTLRMYPCRLEYANSCQLIKVAGNSDIMGLDKSFPFGNGAQTLNNNSNGHGVRADNILQ